MHKTSLLELPDTQKTSTFRAYLELCKPRVNVLILLTAMIGMFLASPNPISLKILIPALLGIALTAGAGAVLNHVAEEKIDKVMKRTANRPLPRQQIPFEYALGFGLFLLTLGITILFIWVNPITAILSFFTFIGYAIVYTLLLKWLTPQNIVIGGLAGAMPPLLGWTAVTGQIDPYAWLLVLIIFVWTPPHFWALCIARLEDYAKINMPMLPVTHGIVCTKEHIWFYTILLSVVSLLPVVFGMSGIIYLVAAIILNLRFLYWSYQLKKSFTSKYAMKNFRYSIFYLTYLFLALLFDHYFLWSI